MKSNIKREVNFFLVSWLLVLSIINGLEYLNINAINVEEISEFKDEPNSKLSVYWDLTGISISGNNGWATINSTYEWCNGAGSWSDPYIIENITIDDGSIRIEDSDVYFKIRNCTLFNGISGIILINVSNGNLIDNTLINLNSFGIVVGESSYNNTISGNNLNNVGTGISLQGVYNNTISGNDINNTSSEGIQLGVNSFNNYISGNTLDNNSRGIFSYWDTYNNTISRNNITNSRSYLGIYLSSGGYNYTVSENIMTKCGVQVWGDLDELSSHKIDTSNKVNGKILYYYTNEVWLSSNNFLNVGQVILVNCNDSIISNLDITHVSTGISLYYCRNITISGNTANYNGGSGIYLGSSNNNIVSGNILNSNFRGIYIGSYSNDNIISGNVVINNHQGITVMGESNLINNNNFSGNDRHAWDQLGGNQWDNGSIGNYWDDYGGVDANDDGIGDSPYPIPAEKVIQDNFPIWDDGDDLTPEILIISPIENEVFGHSPPSFTVEIRDPNLDTMWYTLDNGLTNKIFTTNGTINQTMWDTFATDFITIKFYANDTLGHESFTEVVVIKDVDVPSITIIDPEDYDLCGTVSPSFTVEITDWTLDTMWYTLDGGITIKPFTNNGSIEQGVWDDYGNGTVTIMFYANDSAGNIRFEEVLVRKDIIVPNIIIDSPIPNDLFGNTPPNLDVDITDSNIDRMWYTLDDGATNYFFTMDEVPVLIALNAWNSRPDGMITIKVYANDTASNEIFEEVSVEKDITLPIITILKPTFNDDVSDKNAPSYQIEIDELNLEEIWYSLDGGANNYSITLLEGAISLGAWDDANYGIVTITFYARDEAGNIGTKEVSVNKIESPEENIIDILWSEGILIPLIGGIVGGSVGLVFYYLRRRRKKAVEPEKS